MIKFHYSLVLINLIFLPLSACQFFPSIPSRPQQKTMVIESQKSMYSHQYLEQQNARLSRRINNELFLKGIKPHLTAQERQKLNNVTFQFPLIGEFSQTPLDFLDFYSISDSEPKSVVMPILSLVFFEDLYTAYAWLHTNGYSVETIDEYVTMLKYKKPSDFPNGRYPSPLEALQIPKNALENKKVDELSLRFRNTAYAFILLHELGHILYEHKGYDGISRQQARQHEEMADQFALDVLERAKTIPMGAVLFLQAQAYFIPNKGQLMAEGVIKTEADWQDYLNQNITHPLTTQRLNKMAVYLNQASRRNTYGKDSQFVQYLSQQLIKISDILAIEDLQGCITVVAFRSDLSNLAPRTSDSNTESLLERWCSQSR